MRIVHLMNGRSVMMSCKLLVERRIDTNHYTRHRTSEITEKMKEAECYLGKQSTSISLLINSNAGGH